MGYFANGIEGANYLEKYCYRCIHWEDKQDGRGVGCPVMDLHFMYNYEECNNADSFLHTFIPRNGIYNEQCLMFIPSAEGKA